MARANLTLELIHDMTEARAALRRIGDWAANDAVDDADPDMRVAASRLAGRIDEPDLFTQAGLDAVRSLRESVSAAIEAGTRVALEAQDAWDEDGRETVVLVRRRILSGSAAALDALEGLLAELARQIERLLELDACRALVDGLPVGRLAKPRSA